MTDEKDHKAVASENEDLKQQPQEPDLSGQATPLDDYKPVHDPALFEAPQVAPVFDQTVQISPLHLFAAERNQTNEWVKWNDFSCVEHYQDLENDYQAMRYRAGICDISALTKYLFTGPDVTAALNRLMTIDVTKMAVGQSARTFYCTDDGFVIGEGILYCLEENEYRLTTEGYHLDWFMEGVELFQAVVEDTTEQVAGILLAGPACRELLKTIGLEKPLSWSKGQGGWIKMFHEPVYLTRTGSLGADSFELWMDIEDAPLIWTRLLKMGEPLGLAPFGEGARRLARLEAGHPSFALDYVGAFAPDEGAGVVTPFDLGLGKLVDGEKSSFAGKAALKAVLHRGASIALIGIEISQEGPVSLSTLHANGKRAGWVSSCLFSPGLNRYIALGHLSMEALGTDGVIEVDAVLGEKWSQISKRLPVKIAEKPFLTN